MVFATSLRLVLAVPRATEPQQKRWGIGEFGDCRRSVPVLLLPGNRSKVVRFRLQEAVNLAITMALAQVRVLLVDADLRRGTLHRVFKRDFDPGLSDLLLERAPAEKCILPTSVPNLDLARRGTSILNPGEIFLSARLDQFLRDVYESYDCVIFDSSPVAADDTTSLAPKLDAALIVVRFSYSSTRLSKKAIELLRDRQANMIGLVCNDVSQAHQEYYHYKYPEYYGSQAARCDRYAHRTRYRGRGIASDNGLTSTKLALSRKCWRHLLSSNKLQMAA